jgi:hypothetical protein
MMKCYKQIKKPAFSGSGKENNSTFLILESFLFYFDTQKGNLKSHCQ